MKAMNGKGPGGRVARAEKKVDKAAKNLISSRDTPSEYDRKRAIQGKTEAKVAKAVSKLDKASKADKPISLKKTLKGIENAKPVKRISDKVQAPLTSGTKTAGKSLSELNKFDKKINVSKVAKEAKPAAKDFNKMLKNRK